MYHSRMSNRRYTGAMQNLNLPIHRLPSELLIEVFEIVKALTEDTSPYIGRWAEITPMLWPPMTHVCHLWRETICGAPSLWRSIHIMNNMQWVRLCLDRSDGVPIEVYIHNPSKLPSAQRLLLENAHRITALSVIRTEYNAFPVVMKLLRASMPMLSELNINAEDSPIDIFPFNDSKGHFVLPALHTVRFSHTQVVWKSPLVHRLSAIYLQRWDPEVEDLTMSLREFLHALDACQALEVLDIDFALPFDTYSFDTGERDVSGPVISLPNMEFLTIWCDCKPQDSPDLYHLLSHLTLPVDAQVEICSVVRAGKCGVLDNIPQDPERLPMIHAATCAEIWGTVFECYREAPDIDERQGDFHFTLQFEEGLFDNEYTRNHALGDFCTLAARAPLREFVIGAVHRTEESWETLFRTFPGMASLTIYGTGAGLMPMSPETELWEMDELFAVLSRLDTCPTRTEPGVPAPHLRALRFARGSWSASLLQTIAHCLRYRAGHGARVAELELELFDRKRDAESDVVHDRLVGDLMEVVDGSVVYIDEERPTIRYVGLDGNIL
ncbi:hypothetical protein C8Q74DRAFT_1360694 [Fomes fomentarius]|nr:hypothetical protein C8Q74DRAFT_1360694 [Fomes fomentarius]